MSHVSSDHPRVSGKTPAASPERLAANEISRPGWPEVVAGLVGLGAVTIGTALLAGQLGLGPVVSGLVFTALTGVACAAGFAAAAGLRIRSLSAFGVRRVFRRWLLAGAG